MSHDLNITVDSGRYGVHRVTLRAEVLSDHSITLEGRRYAVIADSHAPSVLEEISLFLIDAIVVFKADVFILNEFKFKSVL